MQDQFTREGVVLENAIAFWVHRVYQASRNDMYRAFREHGEELTPEQWIVLVRLWAEDGRTQTELGASTYRDRPTMSRILAVMEGRGWLRRARDPEDDRIWRVYLTAHGKRLRDELVPIAQRLVKKLQHGIPERDLAITRATLRRMFENVAGEE